jgi:HSP20 family protein
MTHATQTSLMTSNRKPPLKQNLAPLTGALSQGDRRLCQAPFQPPLALHETPESFYLQLVLPGIEPRDIEIHLERHRVELRGYCRQGWGLPNGEVIKCELNYGTFERECNLPQAVNYEQAQAEYSHGLLTLTLPKVKR